MYVLILGLILFLGAHSVRIFAEDWRQAQIARRGQGPWKGLYSLVSIVGFGLIVRRDLEGEGFRVLEGGAAV